MAKRLLRAIRVAAKYNDDGGLVEEGYTILPSDKKWESKLNDAGLDKKAHQRFVDNGTIEVSKEDDDDDVEADMTEISVADLPAALESVSDVQELRKMRRRDKRATARPAYDARIDALKSSTKAEGAE